MNQVLNKILVKLHKDRTGKYNVDSAVQSSLYFLFLLLSVRLFLHVLNNYYYRRVAARSER